MRIVAIVGSVRRGNTYAMVEAACHALEDAEVELIHLKDIDVHMCDGCLTCDESGDCHIDDSMVDILTRMKEANGLILGTPSRWSLLSGELKVFLDRLNPLAVPESLKGKKAIILAVGQTEGEEAESIREAANSVGAFCDNAGIKVIDTIVAEGCLAQNDLITNHPEVLGACKDSALKLYDAIMDS